MVTIAGRLGDPVEDVWIPSVCNMCYCACGIKVHRVNGVVVKIEGNADSPIGEGRLCPKGVASIMTLYDPHRIARPLRRTNPEKGIGVDPGWEPISWDEALELMVEKLRAVRQENPHLLFFQGTTTPANTMHSTIHNFLQAFGSPHFFAAGGGLHCGNGAHMMGGIMHASWSLVPDFRYCEYALYFGASKGHSAGHVATSCAAQASDARARGMHMVVIDPLCSYAAQKGAEWVPIRVGTDAALALGIANQIVNELRGFDAEYVRTKTNAPYLIGPEGAYLRHAKSDAPLVWDAARQRACAFNDAEPSAAALCGAYTVDGVDCRPAFELLREHLTAYSPERVEEITSVPARNVRRLAQEFCQAAQIGSTIVIGGKQLPYRPVAAIFFRGAQGHKNSANTCMAIDLLNHLVGAADVPGGALGFNPTGFGHPESGRPRFIPSADDDGLMMTGIWMNPHLPYPPPEPREPQSMGLNELFPFGMVSPFMASSDQLEVWRKFDLPYPPKVMINYGANSIMSVGNARTVADSLQRIPFIISIDLFLNEFTDFADLVLPDYCFLERLDPDPNHPPIFNHPAGLGDWCWPIRQPVVEANREPGQERRNVSDVMLEVADRLGIRTELNASFNLFWELKKPYRLERDHPYSWEEICDHVLLSTFGPKHDLAWFKRHGMVTWPKQVEEVYWRPFLEVRVPVYFEYIKTIGEKVRAIAERHDLPLDISHYTALPEWKPCPSHLVRDAAFEFWGFYYRDVLHTNSFTMENPWLDEASQRDPYSYTISMNAGIAKRNKIGNGDLIEVESPTGRRVRGRVALTEGIHPESLGFAACAGHWSPNQPIAHGKGVFYNDLLEVDLEHACPVNLNLDLCVKLKVCKVNGKRR